MSAFAVLTSLFRRSTSAMKLHRIVYIIPTSGDDNTPIELINTRSSVIGCLFSVTFMQLGEN